MSNRLITLRRQSGVALVVLLAVLLIISAGILLDRFDGEASASVTQGKANGSALADAKSALIAWSVTYSPSAARGSTAGTLPFPDRNGDGDYDGMADCEALVASDLVLVGRLPQLGEDSVSANNCGVSNPLNIDPKDGAGESLWYAVSRNVLPGEAGGPINPDMGRAGRMTYPWIQVRDDQGNVIMDPIRTTEPLAVAAVIFAPGPVVGGQDRTGAAAPSNYLDNVDILGTTYDNADVDGCPDSLTAPCVGFEVEEFVVYTNPQPDDVFNDKLVLITVDELMRGVEKRVLGEVAVAMRNYRLAHGAYPWLAGFQNPRSNASGSADSGSSTHLDDGAADFVADGIQVGDQIINTTDGGSSLITAVTTTRIDFSPLLGGIENDFDAADSYQVQAVFESTLIPLERRGQIPVHLPNEIFNSAFRAVWDLDDIDDYYESGDSTLWADDAEFEINDFTFTDSEGICMWTHKDRVDCYGIKVTDLGGAPFPVPSGYSVTRRTVEVQFSFEATDDGTPTVADITAPTATGPRTRRVAIRASCSKPRPWNNCQDDVPSTENGPAMPDPSRFGAVAPPELNAAPFLPRDRDSAPSDNETWIVRITDEDATVVPTRIGVRAVVIDHDVRGDIALSGIRYDLGVAYDDVDDADDELPEWLVENNWHHFLYAAVAQDFVAGGDGDCVGSSTCLTINVAGTTAEPNIRALLVSSGVEWTGQDRNIGDCDGDSVLNAANDSFLCAYFDSDTTLGGYNVAIDVLRHGADTVTLTAPIAADEYSRNVFGSGFNDQIRIIEPLPP
jgi:hypothetical protein